MLEASYRWCRCKVYSWRDSENRKDLDKILRNVEEKEFRHAATENGHLRGKIARKMVCQVLKSKSLKKSFFTVTNIRWCPYKCWVTHGGGGGEPWCDVFADFCAINIPGMTHLQTTNMVSGALKIPETLQLALLSK